MNREISTRELKKASEIFVTFADKRQNHSLLRDIHGLVISTAIEESEGRFGNFPHQFYVLIEQEYVWQAYISDPAPADKQLV